MPSCARSAIAWSHEPAALRLILEGCRVGVSSQAASRVARNRLGARERAQAASGLTGSQRVSEQPPERIHPPDRPAMKSDDGTRSDRRQS